jgi:hypothetical protein
MKHEYIDNRKVQVTRKEGIKRVLQRKGDMKPGQGGKMHNRPSEKANWKRPENTNPPVGA